MKKKLIRIFALLIVVAIGFANFYEDGLYLHRITHASSGHLRIEFEGDDLDGPIFEVENFLPGDCEVREVTVKNNSGQGMSLSVKSRNEEDDDNLASMMDWEIKKGNTVVLTSLLSDYYDDNDGVSLGNFAGNSQTTLIFKACFKTEAGNEFQGTETKFDLIFNTSMGHTTELPEQCSALEGKIKKFILGNGGNQHLWGTSGHDFIDGKGGNDHIFGEASADCLVGSEGNDKIEGGSGEDIIVGGIGNDDLRGESGNDKIFGLEGNDQLRGGSGTDLLDGGSGNDNLHGDSGTDTCVNGESNHSCEL